MHLTFIDTFLLTTSSEIGIITIIPILQTRKLRQREVK